MKIQVKDKSLTTQIMKYLVTFFYSDVINFYSELISSSIIIKE